jgi:hypothetical protein
MAAKGGGGGDSKQGLIITLVIFVLLSIILSVVAYYGYADQSKLEAAAKDAAQKEAATKKDRDAQQFQKLLLKAYGGVTDKDDLKDLAGTLSQYQSGPEFQNIASVMKTKGLDWDQNQNRPAKTLTGELDRLNQELANTRTALAKTDAALKKAKESYENDLAGNAAALKKAQEDLAKANAQNVADREDHAKKMVEALERIAKQDKDVEDLTKSRTQTSDDKDKQIRQYKQEIEDLKLLVKKTQEKLPQTNVLDYDVPKGKIVSLDRAGNVATINLGSSDNVRPGLTFSIFPAGATGKSAGARKGSIEVANVIGAHTATARITDVQNSGRDPIMTGDLLFNPAWSPGQREHVAIAGIIDLAGEGRDSTQDFIRTLQRQGIVVDAYLDPKDMTIKGKMNWNTNFLIIGDQPDLNTGTILKEDDPRTERKKEFLTKMGEIQAEADHYGITKVPVRRFMQLMGLPMPRGTGAKPSADFYFRPGPAGGEGKEPAKNGEKPAPKGKEEKEKEDK